ncbi:TetR/AcrR family transcriptional regulator [Psychromicrobium sp. YIM B11713]|uniref:TetR/AcrR family transcriptional regulator n=1 Tax=Psychromicrobium sp. YIM B11713 TaxID=3145233 RepID=UPI00374EFFFA
MPRWEPDSRERLVASALQLFSEQGYDNTTVAEIAKQAGLTRSTFFRHFPDKREVLAAGQETLSRLLHEGISSAPPESSALTAVIAGLELAASNLTPFNRELGPQLHAIVESSVELRERYQLKQLGFATSMSEALRKRGVREVVARLAAEVGVLAFNDAYERWIEKDNQQELNELLRAAVQRLRIAFTELD